MKKGETLPGAKAVSAAAAASGRRAGRGRGRDASENVEPPVRKGIAAAAAAKVDGGRASGKRYLVGLFLSPMMKKNNNPRETGRRRRREKRKKDGGPPVIVSECSGFQMEPLLKLLADRLHSALAPGTARRLTAPHHVTGRRPIGARLGLKVWGRIFFFS